MSSSWGSGSAIQHPAPNTCIHAQGSWQQARVLIQLCKHRGVNHACAMPGCSEASPVIILFISLLHKSFLEHQGSGSSGHGNKPRWGGCHFTVQQQNTAGWQHSAPLLRTKMGTSLEWHRKLSALTPHPVMAGEGQRVQFRLFNETFRPPKCATDGWIQYLLKADQKPSSPSGVCVASSNNCSGPITCIDLKTVPQFC